MAIDFAKLKAASQVKSSARPLFALVIGKSGSGKSTLIGSLKVPTLFVASRGEHHGALSASVHNSEVFAVYYNVRDAMDVGPEFKDIALGDSLPGDLALAKLRRYLSEDYTGQFQAIGFDGFSDLDFIIRSSNEFRDLCKTEKGAHNTFKEPDVVKTLMRGIVDLLHRQNIKGNHIVATLGATHTMPTEAGLGEVVSPVLMGFKVASTLPHMFYDILFVDSMIVKNEVKHVLSFNVTGESKQKDAQGVVKKEENFSACIRGLTRESLPPLMKADLRQVLALIAKGGPKNDTSKEIA